MQENEPRKAENVKYGRGSRRETTTSRTMKETKGEEKEEREERNKERKTQKRRKKSFGQVSGMEKNKVTGEIRE